MDIKTANETLQKVFAACDTPPNTIPFDKIVLRQKARTHIFFIGKWICFVCIILTLLAPLVFLNSPSSYSHTVGSGQLKIEEHSIKNNKIYLNLSGQDFDLRYSYAIAKDGSIYLPDTYSNETGELVFPYPEKPLQIFVSWNKEEFLQIIITPQK